MQEQDRLEYERWTQTKGGKVYVALYDLENAIDALTDAVKNPEAIRCLRDEVNHMGENRFLAASRKVKDLCDLISKRHFGHSANAWISKYSSDDFKDN